ncbi:hypothetical protein [Bhargavaea cecembensis]|uniref:hypothetical protein n=1 Tax=Bhargavaea cecembensis TaxID=394098 RepID=UPI00058CE3E3|nr:hypothetical protein [Bhargavaea cecembensis]
MTQLYKTAYRHACPDCARDLFREPQFILTGSGMSAGSFFIEHVSLIGGVFSVFLAIWCGRAASALHINQIGKGAIAMCIVKERKVLIKESKEGG